jgi:hypothetical protein
LAAKRPSADPVNQPSSDRFTFSLRQQMPVTRRGRFTAQPVDPASLRVSLGRKVKSEREMDAIELDKVASSYSLAL